MDSNSVVAMVTSVCTAGSTAGVAITALFLSNKRLDRVETSLDNLSAKMDERFAKMEDRFSGVDARLELLTGSMHDIDKRLSIIEDRVGR